MKKYLTQLQNDIQYTTKNLPYPWIVKEEHTLGDWISLEEDEKKAPWRSVEDWTGIKQVALPPDDKLSDAQISVLLADLKALLNALNAFFAVVFVGVPERLEYRTIRLRWQQEHAWLEWHQGFFDLCDEEQEHRTCGFGWEHCQCRAFAEMSKDWDNSPWTEEDEERFEEEMERRRLRRKWDDDFLPF
jgi:hypothetical protein